MNDLPLLGDVRNCLFTSFIVILQSTNKTSYPLCIRWLTDLIDFAWGDPEMHCGSVRSVGSVSCVQKLRKCKLFRLRRIRQPIRSWLRQQIPPPPIRQTRLPSSVDGRMQWASCVAPLLGTYCLLYVLALKNSIV